MAEGLFYRLFLPDRLALFPPLFALLPASALYFLCRSTNKCPDLKLICLVREQIQSIVNLLSSTASMVKFSSVT